MSTDFEENPEQYVVYQGEVMLKNWEDNAQGESVELWLDASDKGHPFKRFNSSKRNPGGTRFLAYFVEISSDEKMVNQELKSAVKKEFNGILTGGQHSRQAALLCKDGYFHQFLIDFIRKITPELRRTFVSTLPHSVFAELTETKWRAVIDKPEVGEQVSKLFMYFWCGITSRRELDYKPKSFNVYHELREAFFAWGGANRAE